MELKTLVRLCEFCERCGGCCLSFEQLVASSTKHWSQKLAYQQFSNQLVDAVACTCSWQSPQFGSSPISKLTNTSSPSNERCNESLWSSSWFMCLPASPKHPSTNGTITAGGEPTVQPSVSGRSATRAEPCPSPSSRRIKTLPIFWSKARRMTHCLLTGTACPFPTTWNGRTRNTMDPPVPFDPYVTTVAGVTVKNQVAPPSFTGALCLSLRMDRGVGLLGNKDCDGLYASEWV